MKHTIVQFDASNSTVIRDGKAKCDRCGKDGLTVEYADLTRIGDDVDTFEFERGIWSVCGDCKDYYLAKYPNDYVEKQK